jgi:putative toxin-antitoxin system antitoxin component (TIGR02293 family)
MSGIDGAVNGIDFLRGLVVASTGVAQALAETESAQLTKLPPASERVSRQSLLERVLERATEVIGSREEALRWLGTPVRALDYATPVSLLVDDAGADQVLAVLTNLEHGIL